MLEFDRVSKFYESPGEIVHAVEKVSMNVSESECIAILGPSGSGKTTLLMLAAGLLRADAGSIRFAERDLGGMSKRELLEFRRTQLGFVFQHFNLTAGLSVDENVAVPLLLRGVSHSEAHARALGALDEVGLSNRSSRLPSQLSGGEQQRVAIARALVGNPKLILADEPTGNLDSENGDAVLALLSSLAREHGAAAVLVTHDARLAARTDRVLCMRDGKLSEAEPRGSVAAE